MRGKNTALRASLGLIATATLTACRGGAPQEGRGAEEGDETTPRPIGDMVEIRDGRLGGASVRGEGQFVRTFRGIPYAAPPVGALWWRPPEPPASWEGTRDAAEWGHRCPQGRSSRGTGDPSVGGLVEWPLYTLESPRYLDNGYELEVREGIEDAYVAPPEG